MSEAKTYIAGLIQNARAAQKEFEERFTTQRAVDEVVRAIALTIYNAKEELAPEVVEETGMGTVAYKITKMIATTTGQWNTMRGKASMGFIENPYDEPGVRVIAKPIGVVGSICPTTNPIITVVMNSMAAIKCRNAIIVAPHPKAKFVSQKAVNMIRAAFAKLGAPEDLIQIVAPDHCTIETTDELLAACDVYRPAAITQLQVVGKQLDIPVFEMGQIDPVTIAREAVRYAADHGNDIVFLDTAGRLHIDEALMDELKAVKAAVKPNEILLVVDAMTGQDAVNAAKAFDDALGIDGVLLTKLDGDARGGAALSIRAATGKPIKFVGTGEKLDMIEPFHPDRMASRILGMGDMLTFIEKAEQQYDEEQAKKLEEKLRKNRLTLSDYLDQLEQLQNMGDLSQIADMLPGGMAKGFDPSQIDEKQMAHNKAIIRSMTPRERENPQILNASRKKRIAAGCGLEVVDVNRLLKSFEMLQQMTKAMTKGKLRGLGGMMGGMPNMNRMHGFGRKKRLK